MGIRWEVAVGAGLVFGLAAGALAPATESPCPEGSEVVVSSLDGETEGEAPESGGWHYADCRADGFVDPNGSDQLVWTRSGKERSLIRKRVRVVRNAPEDARGALRFRTWTKPDRAGVINRLLQESLYNPGLAFRYEFYRVSGGPAAAPAFELFIDTGEPKPSDPVSLDKGYGFLNLKLIYEAYRQAPVVDGQWNEQFVDYTNGEFWLREVTPGGGALAEYSNSNQQPQLTLQEWAAIFEGLGVPADIVGVGMGVGTYNPNQHSYVRYFATSGDAGTSWCEWWFGAGPQ
jgi:hypothetical protein